MAKVEDLIKSIPDTQLRDEIAREVANLKSQKKFGLVFEEHLPEQVLLHSLPIKAGARVVKGGAENEIFTVVEHESGSRKTARFRIVRESDGHEERVFAKELIVIKKFGEPIYPTLVPVDRVTRAPGKPYHTIINAENFHALQLLLYCYEGQVDVIYIDPPYNTGAHDWKYNNSFVDGSDRYRHSKWLAMMKRRLLLARRLLKPLSGVLIVTIDEHELHHLGMLLEKLFPDTYRQMVTIVVNPKGVTQGRFSRVEEYALFAFGAQANVIGRGDDLSTAEEKGEEKDTFVPRWKGLLRSGTNARRRDRPRLFYPVLVDPKRGAVVGAGDPIPLDTQPDLNNRVNGHIAAWPIRTDGSLGNWSVGPATLRQLIAQGYVALGSYDRKRNTYGISYLSKKLQNQISTGAITVKSYDSERNVVEVFYEGIPERQIKTVWHRTKHDAGAYGSDLLRTILGERGSFPFPKSLYAVSDALSSVVLENKSALILDFFAGSGTTLHATCFLNAADGPTEGSPRQQRRHRNEVLDRTGQQSAQLV